MPLMAILGLSQATLTMTTERHTWLKELRDAEKSPRFLTEEKMPPSFPSEREQCIICDKRTIHWLLPENAPLCGDDCLTIYLKNPAVYDPRDLHSRPSPRIVEKVKVAPKPKKRAVRRKRPGRWEPSDTEIKEMQDRISARRRPKND